MVVVQFGGVMRRVLVLGLALLAGVAPLAQSSGVPFTITGVPGEGPKLPEEQQVAARLEASLADALQGRFPCASPTTTADRAGEREDATAQQSAGAGEAESLDRMRHAAGAKDVVTVKVTSLAGRFVVDMAYMDLRTGRTEARTTTAIDGSEGSIDRAANQFASSLQKLPGFDKLKGCTAERDWSGTIGYRFSAEPKTAHEQGGCKHEERSKENWQYTVRIPSAGPATAVVMMTRVLVKDSSCVRKGWLCGLNEPVEQRIHNSQLWQWIGAPRVQARVSFDEVGATLYASVDLPVVEADLTMEGETEYSTPCGQESGTPTRQHSTVKIPARVPSIPGQALQPGQKRVAGSATDGKGGTITWRLVRTNRQQ
jgi:hypothetical protein